MKCSKCGFENPEGMKFCGECGTKMEVLCPSCDSPNPPQFKFCGKCGQSLILPSTKPPQFNSEEGAPVEDSGIGLTEEHYADCARIAHEINEIVAKGRLAELLPLENNPAYLCQVGIWYWSLGHRILARMAYERSIEISPEAPTYLNLAVCCDDMGEKDIAEVAMARFYELVSSREEREQVETMLRQHGKDHLVRS